METTNEEIETETTEKQLRDLRSEYVFCPKCGKKNSFKTASTGQTKFFCDRYSRELSDLWESFKQDLYGLISCSVCNEYTSIKGKYCINCGNTFAKPRLYGDKTRIVRRASINPDATSILGLILTIIGFGSLIAYPLGFYLEASALSMVIFILIPIFAIITIIGIVLGAISREDRLGKIDLVVNCAVVIGFYYLHDCSLDYYLNSKCLKRGMIQLKIFLDKFKTRILLFIEILIKTWYLL